MHKLQHKVRETTRDLKAKKRKRTRLRKTNYARIEVASAVRNKVTSPKIT
jgi:hypothetical protein